MASSTKATFAIHELLIIPISQCTKSRNSIFTETAKDAADFGMIKFNSELGSYTVWHKFLTVENFEESGLGKV